MMILVCPGGVTSNIITKLAKKIQHYLLDTAIVSIINIVIPTIDNWFFNEAFYWKCTSTQSIILKCF